MKYRIATRASKLAVYQAEFVRGLLHQAFPEHSWEIETYTTTGDRILDRPLSEFGGKGVFLKEIEEALLSGIADLAVHSLKDVPAQETRGLHLCAFLARDDPRDVWVSLQEDLLHLPAARTVGTSSLRRSVQVSFYRSDLKIKLLRGNLDTRLRKLKEGQYDAIIVAAAGLHRLQLFDETCMHYLLEEGFIPAIGQGILVLQTRDSSEDLSLLVQQLNDPDSATAARIERSFLMRFQGGCHLPIGGYAKRKNDNWHFRAFIGGIRSHRIVQDSVEHADPDACASVLFESLQRQGAQELLSELTDV